MLDSDSLVIGLLRKSLKLYRLVFSISSVYEYPVQAMIIGKLLSSYC